MDDLSKIVHEQQLIIDRYESIKIAYNNRNEELKNIIVKMTEEFENLKTENVNDIKDINNIITPLYNKYRKFNIASVSDDLKLYEYEFIILKYKGEIPDEISSAISSFKDKLENINNDLRILWNKSIETFKNAYLLRENMVRDTVNAIKAKII